MGPVTFDSQGWYCDALRCESPNCDDRPEGAVPTLLVVHNISLPPGQFHGPAVVEFFTNRLDFAAHPYFLALKQLRVSAHFFVRRSGELIQFVSCAQRAWHAGVSEFEGRQKCNDFSIGVELEGSDDTPFEATQYAALAQLTDDLSQHFPVSAVAGHSEIAPGRKTDPGPFFDWARFVDLLEKPLSRPDAK